MFEELVALRNEERNCERWIRIYDIIHSFLAFAGFLLMALGMNAGDHNATIMGASVMIPAALSRWLPGEVSAGAWCMAAIVIGFVTGALRLAPPAAEPSIQQILEAIAGLVVGVIATFLIAATGEIRNLLAERKRSVRRRIHEILTS